MYAHYMQKSSTDCGIASLRTVLAQLEVKIKNTKELYKSYSIKKDQGLSLGELNRILMKYGVNSNAYSLSDFNEIRKLDNFPMVLVVENDGCAHYIVLHKIENNRYLISNPAEPKIKEYDEEYLQSIFLGFLIYIEGMGEPVVLEEFESFKQDENESIGTVLYQELMHELPMKLKVNMALLLLAKYLLPLISTFIIQMFMSQTSEYSSSSEILLPGLIVFWTIIFFYYVNLKEGKQRILLENKMQERVLLNYYKQKINDLDSGKNCDNVTGYFWNLIYSVSGLVQKFYFKLNVVYVLFLSLLLVKFSVYMMLLLLFWTTIFAIYLKRNIQTVKNNELNIIGKSSAFSASVENNIKTSLDINLFSKNKQSEDFLKSKMGEFLEARIASFSSELKIGSVYQSFLTLMSLSTFIVLGFLTILGGSQQILDNSNGILIISIILSSLAPVIENWLSYQKSTVAIDHIQSSDDYSTEKVEATKHELELLEIKELSIKDLTFSYEEDQLILDKLNIQMNSGNIYGIKGENGAGKSTFVKLLSGILEPDSGTFVFNKNELEMTSLKSENINEFISMYSPEFNVYGNTVGRNIRYKVFNETLSEQEKTGYQDIFNLGMSNNYLLQTDGVNISQGQKQKILIMRALYQNKSIYIFDEPTGNLDDTSKKILVNELQKLAYKKDKIVILISHEEEVLNCADEVLQIQKLRKEE
ncbi:ATP-binding cassette domain-containing protein [Enterococcus sp. AZ177]|uniref:ATP-binding cassette domain-containing protein n=1 Tax=unclassified Enterococcus TaxID=2608891 RepID=UPI003D2FCC6F